MLSTIETVCFSTHSERRKSCRNFKAIGMSANSRISSIQVIIATLSPLFWNIFQLASNPCNILLMARKDYISISSRNVNRAKKKVRQKGRAAFKHLASSLRSKSKIS